MAFAVNEWVFCEFKLQQITEMEGERVTSVKDSLFEMGSRDLSDCCFPLSLRNKRISDEFAWHKDKLHREGARGLNFPDIHRWMVDKWAETMRDRDERVGDHFKEMHAFVADMLKAGKVESPYGFAVMR